MKKRAKKKVNPKDVLFKFKTLMEEGGVTSGTGNFSGTTMDQVHAALRRMSVASEQTNRWGAAYKESPTDDHARGFHTAWIEMRASVDALVKLAPWCGASLAVSQWTSP